ncbi:hypothetical protein HanHA300_Chr03g0082931 [Helianthus annuus]|nr:hypothetical protein HanHA300_Chr03g0082931 [Helianthus annuus]KAJ0607251.1 hypothetical protein HanHA89_Chr03g0094431 [Helianthus annuus]KAJ0767310.1 hypothetical protein HanLR1_Chr03g0087721 [Helianthus annuus]KAJ0773154.1 hypothetical protein HanOQP8_Chr03g0095731 [Helianthus annuus]
MQCCVDHEDEITNFDFGTTTWNCIRSFAYTVSHSRGSLLLFNYSRRHVFIGCFHIIHDPGGGLWNHSNQMLKVRKPVVGNAQRY